MAIEKANPLDGLDDDSFKEEGDENTYNFREAMDQVYQLQDCIFTVPADQVDILRAGLITRKSKDNAKAKNAGLVSDNKVLSFLAYPAKDATGKEIPGLMDVRIKLGPKKSITILDIRVPNDEF
jgi:hypothetical protein